MLKGLFLGSLMVGLCIASEVEITAIYNPNCGCCHKYFKFLEGEGFKIKRKTVSQQELYETKNKLGVPIDKRSCHTMVLKGKFIEGHVPVKGIRELIKSDRARGVFSPHGTLSGWGKAETTFELIE
jgi:hypothetical protein